LGQRQANFFYTKQALLHQWMVSDNKLWCQSAYLN